MGRWQESARGRAGGTDHSTAASVVVAPASTAACATSHSNPRLTTVASTSSAVAMAPKEAQPRQSETARARREGRDAEAGREGETGRGRGDRRTREAGRKEEAGRKDEGLVVTSSRRYTLPES